MKNRYGFFILLIFTTSTILTSLTIEYEGIGRICENLESHKNIKPCCCYLGVDFYSVTDAAITTPLKTNDRVVLSFIIKNDFKKELYTPSFNSAFYLPLKKIRLLI